MKYRSLLLFVMLLLSIPMMVFAQDEGALANIEPTRIELSASDGLALIGDYWAQPEDIQPENGVPAVLLLHMLGSNRLAWEPIIAPLLDAGYNILNVDMRGHGETGGSRDWELAETDIQQWLDWLREQSGVRADAISTLGASIGSNMALIGCANDASCVTAIALSPGLNYQGVQPASSVTEGLAERSALLVGAQGDGTVVSDILAMASDAPGEVGIRLYRGRLHGTNMFSSADFDIIPVVIGWLDEHMSE